MKNGPNIAIAQWLTKVKHFPNQSCIKRGPFFSSRQIESSTITFLSPGKSIPAEN